MGVVAGSLPINPFCAHTLEWGKGTGPTKDYLRNTTPVAFQTLYYGTNQDRGDVISGLLALEAWMLHHLNFYQSRYLNNNQQNVAPLIPHRQLASEIVLANHF